jgi:hypothetical protein
MYGVVRESSGYKGFPRGKYGVLEGRPRKGARYKSFDVILLAVEFDDRGRIVEAEFSYEGQAWYMDYARRVYRMTIDPKKPCRKITLCVDAHIVYKRGR